MTIPAPHEHAHAGPLDLPEREARRVRRVLAVIVVPLVLATLIGMAVLWPGGSSLIGSQPFAADGASLATAEVTSLDVSVCEEARLEPHRRDHHRRIPPPGRGVRPHHLR